MVKAKQYQAVFESPEGQDVLDDLLSPLFRLSESPEENAKLEGERAVAIRIISKLKEANHGKLEIRTPRGCQSED